LVFLLCFFLMFVSVGFGGWVCCSGSALKISFSCPLVFVFASPCLSLQHLLHPASTRARVCVCVYEIRE
jgi:hypothetical protein